MKDNYKLVAITIVFVIVGLILSYISWRDGNSDFLEGCVFENSKISIGEEVIGYKKNSLCFCSEGGIIECLPLEAEAYDLEEKVSISTEDVDTKGLDFESSYLTSFANGNGGEIFTPTFTNTSITDGDLVVVVEKMQTCPSTNNTFEQKGFYEYVDGVIKLYNEVDDGEAGTACIVELKYTLKDFDNFDLDTMQIVFVDMNGIETYASMCVYEDKIYSEDDIFKVDGNIICLCQNGEIVCEEELFD